MSSFAYLVCHETKEVITIGRLHRDKDGCPSEFDRRGYTDEERRRAIELFLARHLHEGVELLDERRWWALEDQESYWHVDYYYGIPKHPKFPKKYRKKGDVFLEVVPLDDDEESGKAQSAHG